TPPSPLSLHAALPIFALGAIGVVLAYRLPWSTALALQQRITGTPTVPSQVSVAVDLERTSVIPLDINSPEYAEILMSSGITLVRSEEHTSELQSRENL